MRIGQQQKHSLTNASQQAFYTDLCAFYAAQEPDLFRTLNAEQQMAFARSCHIRATEHGLRKGASIYAWADFAILAGSHFYRDPFFRPMMARLEQVSMFTEADDIAQARDWLAEWLAAVRGPDNAHAADALRKMQAFHDAYSKPADFALPAGWAPAQYCASMCREFYPQMVEYHGDDLVLARITEITTRAQTYYGLTGEWHLCFMAFLGMSFGTGFDFDELYPWIANPLQHMDKLGPEACVEKLAGRSKIWLDHVLDPKGEPA